MPPGSACTSAARASTSHRVAASACCSTSRTLSSSHEASEAVTTPRKAMPASMRAPATKRRPGDIDRHFAAERTARVAIEHREQRDQPQEAEGSEQWQRHGGEIRQVCAHEGSAVPREEQAREVDVRVPGPYQARARRDRAHWRGPKMRWQRRRTRARRHLGTASAGREHGGKRERRVPLMPMVGSLCSHARSHAAGRACTCLRASRSGATIERGRPRPWSLQPTTGWGGRPAT